MGGSFWTKKIQFKVIIVLPKTQKLKIGKESVFFIGKWYIYFKKVLFIFLFSYFKNYFGNFLLQQQPYPLLSLQSLPKTQKNENWEGIRLFLLENDIKKKCHLLLLFSFYFWDFFFYDNTPYPLSLQKTQKWKLRGNLSFYCKMMLKKCLLLLLLLLLL